MPSEQPPLLVSQTLDTFRARLDTAFHAADIPLYPPVLALAQTVATELQSSAISLETLQDCIHHLTRQGIAARADHLANRLEECNPARNEEILRETIRSLAYSARSSSPVPFSDFRINLERIHYGFVFTAHPTFSLTPEQNRALTCYAYALSTGHEGETALQTLWKSLKTPFFPPDLASETAQSLEAIDALNAAHLRLIRISLEIAAEIYPTEWKTLRPALCSVASWVGFDLDGRSDIVWTGILARRLMLQMNQLDRLIRLSEPIHPTHPDAARNFSEARTHLTQAREASGALYALFSSYDPAHDPDYEALQSASRAMIASAGNRMIHPDRVITLLKSALEDEQNLSTCQDIAQLLSLLSTQGSACAQVHFRVNAVQIHNAIRKQIDLTTHPSDPRFRQTWLERITHLYQTVRPCAIHFGNILEEQASARRLFMLIQQIVKHIDSHSPIRFLIAETESALTVMGALYLARRFGVEDHVDICPLFETERAIEDGAKIIDSLLSIPAFCDWVKKRGRLCIQTGYSDAGRYLGQAPASGAIERLKEQIIESFHRADLPDADLLFFDTHGESVGRGGHPGRFSARMDYIASPALRSLADREDVHLIQESSYQGGDGYLPFLHPDTALAVLTRVMTHWIAPDAESTKPDHDPSRTDPYYDERGAVTAFLAIVRQFQTSLIDDPDYGALLSVFGSALMRPAGSRATKRQFDTPGGQGGILDARAFRAIPHNAILAQMGVLANAVCGFGTAISEDPALFRRMMGNSARFHSLADIALYARGLSESGTLHAYILTLDPGLWLARQEACACTDPELAERHAAVAAHLESFSPFVGLHRISRLVRADFNALAPALTTLQSRKDSENHTPDQQTKDSLAILHALRIALIHRIFMMAMDIPDYSPMHDIPRERLIQHVFRLDIPMVMEQLDEIFPVHPRREAPVDYGEPSEWPGEGRESYAVEHARIFQPIARMYSMILDISAAITQTTGFIG